MALLLILPLAVFAGVMLLFGSISASVEIAEWRRARRHSRRIFRPVLIEGGKGKFVAGKPPRSAPDTAPTDSRAIKLVRSAPL